MRGVRLIVVDCLTGDGCKLRAFLPYTNNPELGSVDVWSVAYLVQYKCKCGCREREIELFVL